MMIKIALETRNDKWRVRWRIGIIELTKAMNWERKDDQNERGRGEVGAIFGDRGAHEGSTFRRRRVSDERDHGLPALGLEDHQV